MDDRLVDKELVVGSAARTDSGDSSRCLVS